WSFVSSNEFDELKNSLATGTTQEAINNGVINNMNFLVPSKNILTKFENVVREFYNKKELNDRENLKLAEMRDLLLPKLMSGEIRLPIEE
ncbi:MAG: restriction endonuclease subunit S, partial [Bacillota bacterium]|nr:restriction endonuclease subunit S [Bacillota bacterium]